MVYASHLMKVNGFCSQSSMLDSQVHLPKWQSFNRGEVIVLYLMVYAFVRLFTIFNSLEGSLSVLLHLLIR